VCCWDQNIKLSRTCVYTFVEGALAEDDTASFADAFYFCVATLTTVGYGDMGPTSASTRLFTCVYVLVGISFIGVCLGIVVGIILDRQEAMLKAAVEASTDIADDAFDEALDLAHDVKDATIDHESKSTVKTHLKQQAPARKLETEDKKEGSNCFSSELRSALTSVAQLLLVIFVGAAWFSLAEETPFIDSIYFATITATTVGYGDFSPSLAWTRLVGCPYMILAVLTTARALSSLGDITLGKRRREAKAKLLARYEKKLTLQELDEVCRTFGGDDGRCSKLEFVIAMLLKEGTLKEGDVELAKCKFVELDHDKSGSLSIHDVAKENGIKNNQVAEQFRSRMISEGMKREMKQCIMDEKKVLKHLEILASNKTRLLAEMKVG